jgi:hypothetical protein
MTYTNFDRHENMNDETRFQILSLIKEVSYSEEIEDKASFNIQNKLYGLFDGYLYADLQIEALKLPTDLASKIIRIFDICNRYPKLETLNQ